MSLPICSGNPSGKILVGSASLPSSVGMSSAALQVAMTTRLISPGSGSPGLSEFCLFPVEIRYAKGLFPGNVGLVGCRVSFLRSL